MELFWTGLVAAVVLTVPTLLALYCGDVELYWFGLGLLCVWPLFLWRKIWLVFYAAVVGILSLVAAGLIGYVECCLPFEQVNAPVDPVGLLLTIALPPVAGWVGIAAHLGVRGIRFCWREFRASRQVRPG